MDLTCCLLTDMGIDAIIKYINDDETYAGSETLATKEQRIADIESRGLDVSIKNIIAYYD